MLDKLTGTGARLWLYGVAFAALGLALFYKLIAPEALPLWMALVAAILGLGATGTAAFKVNQQRKDGNEAP